VANRESETSSKDAVTELDELRGMVAALAAYVAAMPGADQVDAGAAKSFAAQFLPKKPSEADGISPADRMINSIQSIAQALPVIQSLEE
jgi:hypothetical protein